MSLILEALNKADRERDEQAPAINPTPVYQHTPPPADPKHWALYVVVVLLVLILGLLVALLIKQSAPAPAPVDAAPPVTSTQPAPQPAPAPVAPAPVVASSNEVQEIYQDAHTAAPAGEEVETLYAEEPSTNSRKPSRSKRRLLDDLEAEATALDAQENSDPDPEMPLAAPRKTERAAEPVKPAASEAEIDAEMVKRLWEQTKKEIPDAQANPNKINDQIKNAIANNLASYKDVPYLNELPVSYQNLVPSISYENHVYSDKGGTVILNKKPLKSGQELAPSLFVERVVSDGVIMKFKDKRFKLQELSSWVNI